MGGGGGGKQILSLVAMIGLAVFAPQLTATMIGARMKPDINKKAEKIRLIGLHFDLSLAPVRYWEGVQILIF